MKQEGVITKSRECVQLENGEVFSISKYQKNHGLGEGQKVVVKIDTEYPESCDTFCEGDESCIICLCNNKVAVLQI
jgi:hypothetical protein